MPDVSMYTQAALQALHDAIANEPDAEDKHALSKALQIVLQVQAKNQQAGAGQDQGQGQALAGQLGGQSPDAGMAQALAGQLGG